MQTHVVRRFDYVCLHLSELILGHGKGSNQKNSPFWFLGGWRGRFFDHFGQKKRVFGPSSSNQAAQWVTQALANSQRASRGPWSSFGRKKWSKTVIFDPFPKKRLKPSTKSRKAGSSLSRAPKLILIGANPRRRFDYVCLHLSELFLGHGKGSNQKNHG